jgi:hypothetical protein
MHFLQRFTHFLKTCCRPFAANFWNIVEQAVLIFHVRFSVSKALPPLVCALRREKGAALERELKSLQNVFRKHSEESSSALRANYRVACLMGKESEPFSDGVVRNDFNTQCKRLVRKTKLFLMLLIFSCNNDATSRHE